MEPDPNAINWNSLLGALVGGGFALLGVFLAASRERLARQADERERFQRETLIAVLDTLEEFIWDVQAIEQWRREPENWQTAIDQKRSELPESERDNYKPPPFDYLNHVSRLVASGQMERFTKRRLRLEILANQVTDEHVRTQCLMLSVVAQEVVEKPAYERVVARIGPISERIGALLRGEAGVLIELGPPPDSSPRYVSKRRLL